MESIIKTGRAFYAICIATMGVAQLVFANFRTVTLPPWPEWRTSSPQLWAYFTGVLLIGVGAAIIFTKAGRQVALYFGGVFLIILLFWHLPYILFIQPHQLRHFGIWADASKALALCGGAFVVAGSYSSNVNSSGAEKFLERLIPLGPVFFSITMIEFGIDHFLYIDSIATLVPTWMPGNIFWTYLGGAALIGAGVAIILRIKLKLVGILLGVMIFIWFLILHIPRAIADPQIGNGNEVVSAGDALAFSGIAFLIAFTVGKSYRRT